jgi:hypothetical protein
VASGQGADVVKDKDAAKDQELEFDLKALQDARIATDGPGLLAYLKARTPTEEDKARFAQNIKLLGDDAYEVREKATRDLVNAGRLALPFLRPALTAADLEVSRRAEQAIQEIEQNAATALTATVARVLVVRKPPDSVPVLLAYLPSSDDERIEEAVFDALAALGVKDGKLDPALAAAASDKEPLRRAAAAFALAKGVKEERNPLDKLVEDSDPRVRFQAARSLIRAGESKGVAPLIALLEQGTPALGWQVEDMLCRIAGDKAPAVSLGQGDAASRKKCRESWDGWWEKNKTIDVAKVNLEETLLGLTVIAELDGSGKSGQGYVWECGRDGKERMRIDDVSRPADAVVLPGGRILVGEHGANRVTERDKDGKIVWEHRVNNSPVSVQRLANGNTFIATYNELREVTRDQKVVFTHPTQQMIFGAQKQRNGNIVYVNSNNQVIELDPSGKVIHTIPVNGTSGWAGVEKLPNGRYLVAQYSGNKVTEVDTAGKVYFEVACNTAGYAQRLPNGNTLVASIEQKYVAEYDRGGKEVWRQKTQGRPFRVHRR